MVKHDLLVLFLFKVVILGQGSKVLFCLIGMQHDMCQQNLNWHFRVKGQFVGLSGEVVISSSLIELW